MNESLAREGADLFGLVCREAAPGNWTVSVPRHTSQDKKNEIVRWFTERMLAEDEEENIVRGRE